MVPIGTAVCTRVKLKETQGNVRVSHLARSHAHRRAPKLAVLPPAVHGVRRPAVGSHTTSAVPVRCEM